MQITKTEESPTKVRLSITAEATELEPIKKHVLQAHFSDVKVPGFREGRAPLEMIEKAVDSRLFTDEFLEHAINELYKKATDQENLRPVGQPTIEFKKFVPYSLLEFEATQEVVSQITLPDYRKMKLAKPVVTVSSKEVEDVIANLQSRLAERKDVKRPAKNGDEVVIDFKGTDENGKPIAGADGKAYPLLLGSKSFIPGFEEQLIGLSAGDSKQFKLTFPKDYGVQALQSKQVEFAVTVNQVQELSAPKLDDELAKKAGPFKTVAELKADIKKQLGLERGLQTQREYENQLIRNIAAKTKVEIPQAIVDDQIQRMEAEERRNLTYRGQTWQEHLKEEGITEEQHRERQRPEAEERVKGGLILSEIAVNEGLEVSEEEMYERIAQLKQQYTDEAMRAELDKPENRQDIVARILTEKTIAKLVEYASK